MGENSINLRQNFGASERVRERKGDDEEGGVMVAKGEKDKEG